MKSKLFILSLFLVIFISCKQTTVGIDDFDKVIEITALDSIYADEEVLAPITDIGIYDGMLIAKHMRDEYHFSLIDMESGKLVQRWGKQGNGPDEYLDFGSNFVIRDSLLIFSEYMKKKINHVSIANVLNGSDSVNVKQGPYPYTAKFRPARFCFLNDWKLAVGSFGEGRFGVLDSNDSIRNFLFDYPFGYEEIKGIYRGSVFQGDIKSNDKQRKFVISTFASDVFEIYQLADNKIHRTFVSPFANAPQIREKGGRFAVDYDKSIAGFMKMAVSDELICFIYSSLSYTEAAAKGMASREILCFNWKGEKVRKYVLPFPVSNLCVDGRYAYVVRYQDDIAVVYRFELV